MKVDHEALKKLLDTEPVRGRGDNRSTVRKVMDENREVFRALAEKGHPHDVVVAAFMNDHPGLRHSRPDLDDEGFRTHVRNTFVSFKTANGLQKKRVNSARQPSLKQKKVVEGKRHVEVVETPAASSPEPATVPGPTRASVPGPKAVSEGPAVVKPTDKGFRVPKAKDF